MSARILCVYDADPGFPAADQHPEAERYSVAGRVVDTVGGAPTVDQVLAVVAPPPSQIDVAMERERRLSLGFTYDFGDARGVHHIGTTAQDMKGWDEVSFASQAAIACGLSSAEIAIVTDTGPAIITAIEWQQILLAATQHRQPLWKASFILQGKIPIPADYADDSYWTA